MAKILNKGYSDKAIKMKPEFDQLSYSEKLKFMDDHFEGLTGIGNKEGEMIISIFPDPKNKEEIKLFNDRTIKKYESYKDDLFIEYSFDRLKQRFDNEILKIRDSNPDKTCQRNLIKEHIQDQIEKYSQRMTMEGPTKWTKEYYKGNWDLSKKVIDTSFLQARAWENYIGFLQSKIDTPEIELINSKYTDEPKKEYNCLKVARAFCLWELFKTGQLENYCNIRPDGIYRFKRNMFESYIRSQFKLKPKESSATIYAQAIQFINSKRYEFYTQAAEYVKDYNYGLKLFNTM